jgi:hypothetical protein
MNCVEWQERIALHAGGDTGAGEAADGERHLGECPGCQVFWSGLRECVADLREAHEELPDAAHFTAVRTRVMVELERSRQVWRRLAWISGLVALVLLTVALWPRGKALPEPPRMVAAIPAAPLVVPVRHTRPVRRAEKVARTPVTVQLQTADPNIVIYWIAD